MREYVRGVLGGSIGMPVRAMSQGSYGFRMTLMQLIFQASQHVGIQQAKPEPEPKCGGTWDNGLTSIDSS